MEVCTPQNRLTLNPIVREREFLTDKS